MRSIIDVLQTRRWIALGVLVLALLATPLFLKMLHPTYTGQASVALVGNGPSSSSILPSGDLPDVALSYSVLSRVKEKLNLPYSVDQIKSKASARLAPHSNIMSIVFNDKNPSYAATTPNALADATVVEYKQLAARQYDQLVNDLRRQLSTNQAQIHNLDTRLQDVAQNDTYAGQEHALDSLSTRLSDLEAQRGAANATLIADSASANQSASQGKLQAVFRQQALASDPYYVAVRQAQAKDAADLIATKAGYTKEYPGLPGLQEKVSREIGEVNRSGEVAATANIGASTAYAADLVSQRTARSLVAGDRARVQAIDDQMSQVQSHLKNLAGDGVTASGLRLLRDSNSLAYQQLASRLQQTLADQAQAAALSGLVVLEYAEGSAPKIPTFTMAILIGLVILVAVVGSAYAAEALDPRLRKPSEIEELYGGAHLGSIVR